MLAASKAAITPCEEEDEVEEEEKENTAKEVVEKTKEKERAF